jgi:CubicO group peptidase (beta-lactamase class C family)
MTKDHNLTSNTQRRLRIGILAGVALVIALIIIALFSPRFLTKGPYQKPPTTGDGWMTASLSEVGMDEKPILELLSMLAQQNELNIHSLLIVKDGKLVFETYYPGDDITVTDKLSFTRRDFDRDTLHCLASASKSVTSILFGMAVDQGKITNLDEKMFASFPEYAELSDQGKDEITLRHLLTMTSGLAWDESSYPFSDPRNDLNNMVLVSPDPIRFMLAKPLINKPGEVWLYNSGVTNLLGEILNRKTGTSLVEYARANLFNPLGITSFEWLTFPAAPKMAVTSSLLYLEPRDMAKIGQLYLQQGKWNGVQIVSPQWVQESTAMSVRVPIEYGPTFQNIGYGYQWWHGRFAYGETDAIYAAGWGGQFILIMPKINTVIVTTGSNYAGDYSPVFDLINNYILDSIYSGA